MTEYIKRGDSRESCEIPIVWTDYNSGDYRNATVCNRSEGGLYFKSQFKTTSKSDIFIKPLNDLIEPSAPKNYKFYEAKVKWFQELPTNDGLYFGIGVQYLAKSHKIYAPSYHCSMCDRPISFGDIHEIDDFVYLCPFCLDKYDHLPEGLIKRNLKNLMMGNVI